MIKHKAKPEHRPQDTQEVPVKAKKSWPLLKIFGLIAVVVLLFTAGLEVGRGNLHVQGLSAVTSVNQNLPGSLNYSSVNEVYNLLKNNYDGNLDTTKLTDGLKTGLVDAAGDPYTEYFNPTDAKALNNELAGSITGIGAQVGSDANNNIVIVSPLSGYPAAAAGLQPKDVIAAIDGKSTQGISVDTAVTRIRGTAGSKVTLTIVRNGGNPFNVAITRQKITVPSVTWSEDGNVGYIKISQFTDDTDSLAAKAAQEFKDKGVKGVVLDLRGNPGGYLSDAVNISSLWLKQDQTVVSERRGSTIIDTENATGVNPLAGLPTVVLIDAGSASASEITAGALHDNGAATLVGVTSFGKGSVQEVKDLSNGGELKVTIAHWYTPNGKNINKQGITPDVVVTNPSNAAQTGQDPQKDKAIEIVQSKIQ